MSVFNKVSRRPIPDLRELLWGSAGQFGSAVAFREKTEDGFNGISFARYRDEVEALGTSLCKKLKKGSHVILLGRNGYNWVLGFMALICGAGIPVPADADISPEALAELAAASDAEAILYDAAESKKLFAVPGLSAVSFAAFPKLIRDGKCAVREGDSSFRDAPLSPEAPAAIFYTSGTAGPSKGVVLSHANIAFTLTQIGKLQSIDKEDVFLAVLPLSHIYQCVVGFLAPLAFGATVVFSSGLAHVMRDMRAVQPTTVVAVPLLAEAIYKKFWQHVAKEGLETEVRRSVALSDPVRPLSARQSLKMNLLSVARAPFGSKLERMIVLGSFLDPVVQKGLRQIGIFTVQGYGITECAGLAALGGEDSYQDGSAGQILPDGTLEIYNAQSDGSGEIRVKGGNVMLGYYKDEARTKAVLQEDYYYTGDLGKISGNGFVQIIGRKENAILTADGNSVCPEELERMLCQSPFIKEAAVVKHTDKEGKIEPAALIYPNVEEIVSVYGSDVTIDQVEILIGEWVGKMNETLPAYKQILLYALREQPLPRDDAYRILRAGLEKELQNA